MPLNIDKMRKHREQHESDRGRGDWWNPTVGEHLFYVAGPCREDDDLNYVEVVVHYGVGPKNNMTVCLTPKVNPILKDARVADLLDGKKDISDGCPVCVEWERLDKEMQDAKKKAADELKKQRDNIRRNTRFIFNVAPIGKRKRSSEDWEPIEGKLMPYACGSTVWEGILDVIFTEGDITDPDKAILVRMTKSGEGMQTKYKVVADGETLRKPRVISKAVKAQMRESFKEGGAGDLYKIVSDMVRASEDVEALLSGVEMADQDDEDDAKACFGLDYTKDVECKECPRRGPCSKKCDKPLYKGHDLEEGDEDFEGEEEEEPTEKEPEEEPEEEKPAKTGKTGKGSKDIKDNKTGKGKGKEAFSGDNPGKEGSSGDDDAGLDALERELAKRGKK